MSIENEKNESIIRGDDIKSRDVVLILISLVANTNVA